MRMRVVGGFVAALVLVAVGWGPASAEVRRPISSRDLWPGHVTAVAIGAHGDVIVTGSCCFRRREHMVVRRYTRDGVLQWERTLSRRGRHAFARGEDVAVGPEGTVFVTGALSMREELDEVFPTVATFVRAYGPAGSLRWQRVFSIEGPRDLVPTGVAAGPGFVVVTGYTTSFESVVHEGWVRAWSRHGRPLWVDDFEFAGLPDDLRDMPTDVAVDADGSIYVVGVVDRLFDEYEGGPDPADSEVVVRRMTSTGEVAWTHVLSDRSDDSDLGMSIAVRDRRVILGAVFAADTEGGHPWVRSYAPSGRAVRTHVWSGGGWFEDLDVAVGREGRVYTAWFGERGTHVKALTGGGRACWTSRTTTEGEVDLSAGRKVVRFVGQGRSHARLITFRA